MEEYKRDLHLWYAVVSLKRKATGYTCFILLVLAVMIMHPESSLSLMIMTFAAVIVFSSIEGHIIVKTFRKVFQQIEHDLRSLGEMTKKELYERMYIHTRDYEVFEDALMLLVDTGRICRVENYHRGTPYESYVHVSDCDQIEALSERLG